LTEKISLLAKGGNIEIIGRDSLKTMANCPPEWSQIIVFHEDATSLLFGELQTVEEFARIIQIRGVRSPNASASQYPENPV
jgi:hypothetical protein